MRKAMKLFTILVTTVLFLSFTSSHSKGFIGTYGVSPSDPSQIKLTINSDHTFYYQDYSVSERKIAVTGSWELEKDKIVLKAKDSKIRFHKIWTFSENGHVAKSRNGFCFYRLTKVDS